jgi:hypothetical protein
MASSRHSLRPQPPRPISYMCTIAIVRASDLRAWAWHAVAGAVAGYVVQDLEWPPWRHEKRPRSPERAVGKGQN